MPHSVTELLEANLYRVFGERDGDRRRAVIAEIYAEDVTFADPEEVVIGRDAVDAKVQHLLDGAPDFVFTASGPVRQSHDLGLLDWEFGPAGGPPVVSGTDIVIIVDGRIASLHTLLATA